MNTPLQCVVGLFILCCAVPAVADDRVMISALEQQLSDAIASGGASVWDRYLSPDVIFVEEDGTYKGKADMVREIRPLPSGITGTIRVQLLSYHEQGDVAVALFRQNESEDYFGQALHAKYLTTTTWRKRADGWRLIAAQVLAEKTDPPAIEVPPQALEQYVGSYRLGHSSQTYTLKVVHGELHGVRDDHPEAVWQAEAPDVFFLKDDPRIRKIFQRDARGKIIGFVERRETWDIVWTKRGP